MSRIAVSPFLVSKESDGCFRLTRRATRFNSQGYPLVTTELLTDTFKTATAARAHARDEYGAEKGDISSK